MVLVQAANAAHHNQMFRLLPKQLTDNY